jgi:hypothetical protein
MLEQTTRSLPVASNSLICPTKLSDFCPSPQTAWIEHQKDLYNLGKIEDIAQQQSSVPKDTQVFYG